MPETQTRAEAVAKIAALIENTQIAMLTSITDEGHLHARPMALLNSEFDGDLWFFTGKTSPKIHQIETNPRVNVAFSEPAKQNYVSLSGTATLVMDRALNEKYWKTEFQAWFPQGLDDPELSLLKIHVDGAEYWDVPSSTIAHIKGFIQAKITGQSADVGDHAKVHI